MGSHEPERTDGERPAAISSYYDDFWSGAVERRFEPEPTLKALITNGITERSDCLDVGCGSGNSYAGWINKRAQSYVGVDVSAAAVDTARACGLDARVIADAAELPFEDESFDVVLCIEVLEHLFAPQRAASEILRVLRPSGRLVASVPNVGYWRLRANMLFGLWNPLGDELSVQQPWRDPHIRFFTPTTLERMLRSVGFADVTAAAHGGRFADHATSRPTDFGPSRMYRRCERLFPSLLGLTVHAVAVK